MKFLAAALALTAACAREPDPYAALEAALDAMAQPLPNSVLEAVGHTRIGLMPPGERQEVYEMQLEPFELFELHAVCEAPCKAVHLAIHDLSGRRYGSDDPELPANRWRLVVRQEDQSLARVTLSITECAATTCGAAFRVYRVRPAATP